MLPPGHRTVKHIEKKALASRRRWRSASYKQWLETNSCICDRSKVLEGGFLGTCLYFRELCSVSIVAVPLLWTDSCYHSSMIWDSKTAQMYKGSYRLRLSSHRTHTHCCVTSNKSALTQKMSHRRGWRLPLKLQEADYKSWTPWEMFCRCFRDRLQFCFSGLRFGTKGVDETQLIVVSCVVMIETPVKDVLNKYQDPTMVIVTLT